MMRWYRRRKDARTGDLYYEHRAIPEWRLGRQLRPGEIAHHRNGDRTDNHPDNLEVLPSQRAHMIVHHLARREATGLVPLFDRATLLEARAPEKAARLGVSLPLQADQSERTYFGDEARAALGHLPRVE